MVCVNELLLTTKFSEQNQGALNQAALGKGHAKNKCVSFSSTPHLA
jgi:hypothetical protein